MVKDRHLTKAKLPVSSEGGGKETTYSLTNSTSNSSKVGGDKVNHSSGLRGLVHHALPHSPLPTSKGHHSDRHSPSATSSHHFFAKCTSTATTKEPLETTTTLNRHVSSKCSRTLNRLLWICNKSSSVSSNSSGVSTSTNSSASSHRASFSGHNAHSQNKSGHEHRHNHHHQHNANHKHHHHSTPSLALTSTLLCPLNDKQAKMSALTNNDEHYQSGLSTATDTPSRSNGYGPVNTTTIPASSTVAVSTKYQGTVLFLFDFAYFVCIFTNWPLKVIQENECLGSAC